MLLFWNPKIIKRNNFHFNSKTPNLVKARLWNNENLIIEFRLLIFFLCISAAASRPQPSLCSRAAIASIMKITPPLLIPAPPPHTHTHTHTHTRTHTHTLLSTATSSHDTSLIIPPAIWLPSGDEMVSLTRAGPGSCFSVWVLAEQ